MNLIYILSFFAGFRCNLSDISFDFYNISIKFKYRQWIYIAYVSWSKIVVVYVNRIMRNIINVLLHLIVHKKNILIEMKIHTKHIIKIINKNKKEAKKTNLVCSLEHSYLQIKRRETRRNKKKIYESDLVKQKTHNKFRTMTTFFCTIGITFDSKTNANLSFIM